MCLCVLAVFRGWHGQVAFGWFELECVQHALLLGGDLVRLADDAVLGAVVGHQQWPENLLELLPGLAGFVLGDADQ